MITRVFLGASALLWLPYGVFCFAEPGFLESAAGVAATSPTGTVELRAMYGGLQAGLGALAGTALARPALERPALLALAFLAGGLGSARLLAAIGGGGFSVYTLSGLGFEWVTLLLAVWLLRR